MGAYRYLLCIIGMNIMGVCTIQCASLIKLGQQLREVQNKPGATYLGISRNRHYDEVSVITAHNAFSSIGHGYIPYAQQTWTIEKQLQEGVRGLMLDIYDFDKIKLNIPIWSDIAQIINKAVDGSKMVAQEIAKYSPALWLGNTMQNQLDEWGINVPVTPARVTDALKDVGKTVAGGLEDIGKKTGKVFGFADMTYFTNVSQVKKDSISLCHGQGDDNACPLSLLFRGIKIGPSTINNLIKQGKVELVVDKLDDALKTVATFLQANPTEIVTLFLENYVQDPQKLVKAFANVRAFILTPADLQNYRALHPEQMWPTLGWMQDTNKRLVILDDRYASEIGFFQRDVMTETGYSTLVPKKVCVERHSAQGGYRTLYCLNLFPAFPIPVSAKEWSSFTGAMKAFMTNNDFATINSSLLRQTVNLCYEQGLQPDIPNKPRVMKNRWPNFLVLDHVNRGDPFAFAAQLNAQMWPAYLAFTQQNTERLFQAISSGSLAQVQQILADGSIDFTMQGINKETVIHMAIYKKAFDVVRLLVQQPGSRLSMNLRDAWGRTPLQAAQFEGLFDVELLLLGRIRG